MSKADESAFPMQIHKSQRQECGLELGLTKRELFAGLALNKLARANRQPERLKVIAEICVAQADALILELSKNENT